MLIGRDYHHLCNRDIAEDPAGEGPSGYFCKLGWYFTYLNESDDCLHANLCNLGQKELDDSQGTAMKGFNNLEDNEVKVFADPVSCKKDQSVAVIFEKTTTVTDAATVEAMPMIDFALNRLDLLNLIPDVLFKLRT